MIYAVSYGVHAARRNTLWTLTKGAQTASAVIATSKASASSCDCCGTADLRQSQVFRTPTAVDDALAEADMRRRDLESRGWQG